MNDPSRPVFETTDSGSRVAGTGLPRLRAAVSAGAASRGRVGASASGAITMHRRRADFWRIINRCRARNRRTPRRGRRGFNPYTEEEGPGKVSAVTRLWADLWHYGPGKTKDAFGTEADVRAISDSSHNRSGFKLRVLTQNLWALPVIGRYLEARVHAFAKTLGRGWDVIALQEVWHARERDALRRAALAAGLRYSRHFEQGCGAPIMGSGSGGTGLLVLSRFPISESFFWRFSVNGQPYQMLHCDYLGGKGIGLARLYTPAGAVDLYISHLHADYSCNTTSPTSGSKDRYKAHRVAQAFEVAHIIRLTSKSPLVLLLTDLNSGPGSMPYGLQRSVAELGDAFAEANPTQTGHTYDTKTNVFAEGRHASERLDYVLYKAMPTWELSNCWVHKAYVEDGDTERILSEAAAPPRSASSSLSPSVSTSLSPPVPRSRRARTPIPSSPTEARGATSPPPLRPNDALGSLPPGTERGHPQPRDSGSASSSSRLEGVGGTGDRSWEGTRRRKMNISDHHGVAAEFTALDPESDDVLEDCDEAEDVSPALSVRRSGALVGGNFPQGPLLARALTEIDRGIEEATARRLSHLFFFKALMILWLIIVAGGVAAGWQTPLWCVARGAAAMVGGILCACASGLFLAYWFSAKEEVQGLKEVFQSATNYERHLPMEEAFPDAGFDTSQFYRYMEQHFR
ncbi:unnamed protein product [Ascophyllum nodosum]